MFRPHLTINLYLRPYRFGYQKKIARDTPSRQGYHMYHVQTQLKNLVYRFPSSGISPFSSLETSSTFRVIQTKPAWSLVRRRFS